MFKYLYHRLNLNSKTFWSPITKHQKEELQVGDYIMCEKLTETKDLIAGLCGLSNTNLPAGDKVLWKVIKVLDHGSVLLKNGYDRVFFDYFPWVEGNLCRVEPQLFRQGFDMKVYYRKRK